MKKGSRSYHLYLAIIWSFFDAEGKVMAGKLLLNRTIGVCEQADTYSKNPEYYGMFYSCYNHGQNNTYKTAATNAYRNMFYISL